MARKVRTKPRFKNVTSDGKRVGKIETAGRTKKGNVAYSSFKPMNKRHKRQTSEAVTVVNYKPTRGKNKGKRMRATILKKIVIERR